MSARLATGAEPADPTEFIDSDDSRRRSEGVLSPLLLLLLVLLLWEGLWALEAGWPVPFLAPNIDRKENEICV